MSLAKLIGPSLVAVSSLFVASAAKADVCNLDSNAARVVDFIVETTPEHWNADKLSFYGVDKLEEMKQLIVERYDGHVKEVFDGLRKSVEAERNINWERVLRNSSYTFYSVIEDLRDSGDVTVSSLNTAESEADELMNAYIAEANVVIDAAIELAADGSVCLVDPNAPKPAR